MTKKIKKLESETNQWRLKCESTDKSLQLVIKQVNTFAIFLFMWHQNQNDKLTSNRKKR